MSVAPFCKGGLRGGSSLGVRNFSHGYKRMNSNHHPSVDERRDYGKSLRKQSPRSSHGDWQPAADRPDPVELLEEQNKDRVPWLVPVRRSRMMASPFSFYRGAARVMAHDLSTTPVSGLNVQACGDAHLANFGFYASPERQLLFDINDFDETLEGPWEWDLERLAASFVIAARHNELNPKAIRRAAGKVVQHYRESMGAFAKMRTLDIWYASMNEQEFLATLESDRMRKRAKKTLAKAKTKDSLQALDRLTEESDGNYVIRHEPPLLVPLRELDGSGMAIDEQLIHQSFLDYKSSLSADCRVLLDRYQPKDFAVKVVGVGSVGTRCFILLLEGRDRDDPLFLQMKEAVDSVLAEYLGPSPYENQGQRVVEGQRLMQSNNDIFLGWQLSRHQYYWRQLRDWKGSVNIEHLDADDLTSYARLCGWTLAHAHARTGDPVAIAGYLGNSATFDDAMTEFAERYADQNQRDYEAFLAEAGRLEAAPAGS